MAASVGFISWSACEPIVGEQAHMNDTIPKQNRHSNPIVQYLFFIVIFLSFKGLYNDKKALDKKRSRQPSPIDYQGYVKIR
jgi:hypothetical protein